MRFKGGPHENPARGVVTIFLPKSAHAHPNSNNPPGRRDLAAITIAGGASSRSRAAVYKVNRQDKTRQPRSSRDRAIYDLRFTGEYKEARSALGRMSRPPDVSGV